MKLGIFINMGEKRCCICGLVKTVDEFHKNKSKKDGIQDLCKECRKVKSEKTNLSLVNIKKSGIIKIRIL